MNSIPSKKLVVENDPFLRLIQVVLDATVSQERIAAFSHFLSPDLADFHGWCEQVRSQVPNLFPSDVALVDDKEHLLAQLPGAVAAVVEELPFDSLALTASKDTLKVVHKFGYTTRNIDQAECDRAGVQILTIRRRANIATSEQALMLMLALARQVTRQANMISVEQLQSAGYQPTTYDRKHTANGNWAHIPGMVTLYKRQLGIVGLGEIGRELALRAASFGMSIVYYQRTRLPAEVEEEYHATYVAMEELLKTSDFVSLHLPRSPQTVGIIGERELSLIKPGAFLINVSQPNLVDRQALQRALVTSHLGGFGLDIYYDEPGDANDPLIQLPNVIVTPHMGGSPRWNALDDIEEVILNLSRSIGTT